LAKKTVEASNSLLFYRTASVARDRKRTSLITHVVALDRICLTAILLAKVVLFLKGEEKALL
jgi:hypothetical protein